MLLETRPACLLVASLLVLGIYTSNHGQSPNPSPTEETSKNEQTQKGDDDRIRQLTQSIEELKKQNAVASKQLDTLSVVFFLVFAFLALGSFTSFMSWRTDRGWSSKLYDLTLKHDKDSSDRERVIHGMQDELYRLFMKKENDSSEREKLIHERQDALYNVSLNKETESSERDRKIFAQSTETLTLVNQTLKLAKDASERASKSLEEKLNRRHDELEREAIELIDESKAYRNFKVLVEDSNSRSNLLTLALEISGLQNNQNILDKDVALNPYCCFIRGMEFHLNQHFKPAIKYWKLAKDHPSVTDALKIVALYWIGYEQNNKGDFDNAAANFELASGVAKGSLRYELERIRIESRFFDTEKFTAEKVIPEMEALYDEVKRESASDEYQRAKSAIAGTLGNMYYQLGNDLYDVDRDQAMRCYQKAKQTFADAPIRNKWNWFGYGEACFRLREFEEAEDCFLNKVKPEAEFEYSTRPEPRTKVLGQTTVLICSMRVKDLHDNVNTLYNLIKATLGSVDDRVTVYSQFERRNVFKGYFLEDLNKVMADFERTNGENA